MNIQIDMNLHPLCPETGYTLWHTRKKIPIYEVIYGPLPSGELT